MHGSYLELLNFPASRSLRSFLVAAFFCRVFNLWYFLNFKLRRFTILLIKVELIHGRFSISCGEIMHFCLIFLRTNHTFDQVRILFCRHCPRTWLVIHGVVLLVSFKKLVDWCSISFLYWVLLFKYAIFVTSFLLLIILNWRLTSFEKTFCTLKSWLDIATPLDLNCNWNKPVIWNVTASF